MEINHLFIRPYFNVIFVCVLAPPCPCVLDSVVDLLKRRVPIYVSAVYVILREGLYVVIYFLAH